MTQHRPPALPPQRPDEPSGPDIYQQAAKGAWAAPLVAAVIGVCMGNMPDKGGTAAMVAMVRLAMDIILIGAGLTMGIFALTGIPKRGTQGVLVPAIIGLVINVGLIALSVYFVVFIVPRLHPR